MLQRCSNHRSIDFPDGAREAASVFVEDTFVHETTVVEDEEDDGKHVDDVDDVNGAEAGAIE
jgi:hypothetical protein